MPPPPSAVTCSVPQPADSADFADIARLSAATRQQAVQAVNTLLVGLYWQIGRRISRKIAAAEWGDGVVVQLAGYLAQTPLGLRGFTRRNLFRMRHFYEAYAAREIVSTLLTQLPWTHHLIILGQEPRPEQRKCYLRLRAVQGKGRWSGSSKPLRSSAPCYPAKVAPLAGHIHPDSRMRPPTEE
ncbi:DUF1016 N-terminal domain-containing protein [Acidovorax sp. LjRoot117]|uniref:DUF1016 N-terminal domain-containing protein n=1 Tax=Acidovorax sp. LjRoot117 TaxID=3342255 RepID=UPI003ED0FA0A